jgi:YD repeat-containing protein
MRRSYNSVTLTGEPIGYGWHHGYDWQAGLMTNVPSVQITNDGGRIYLTDGIAVEPGVLPPGAVRVRQTFLVVQAVCDLNRGKYQGDYLWFVQQVDGTFRSCSSQYNRYEARVAVGGGYEVIVPGGLVYAFGTNGVLLTITHPAGQQVTLDYEAVSGGGQRLAKVRHSNGQYLEFHYAGAKLVRVTTPDPEVYVEYEQDGNGDLVAVTHHDGGRVDAASYTYVREAGRSRHWLRTRRNVNEEEFQYAYGTASGPSALTLMSRGPNGEYALWVEYVANHLTRTRFQRGDKDLVSDYVFDPVTALPLKITGPNDPMRVESFRYDGMLSPVGHRFEEAGDYVSVEATYDAGRNPLTFGVGFNQTAVQDWHLGWNTGDKTLASVTDPMGRQLTVGYSNSLPVEVAVHGESGSVYRTQFSHLPGGLLVAVTNANGNGVRYAYDSQGYVTNVTVGTGLWVAAQYNVLGAVTNVTLPGENGNRIVGLRVDGRGPKVSITTDSGS